MFSFQELAIASDLDLTKINPNMSDFDQKVELANQAVRRWMKDPQNLSYLNMKKADYIHDKGWTSYGGTKGSLKHEVDIPQEAFIMLPTEIRNDKKELMKWAQKHHPYLFHKRIM